MKISKYTKNAKLLVLMPEVFLNSTNTVSCCRCGTQKGDDKPHSMDTSKIEQLGFPGFRTISQMFDDCIRSFQDKGFL